MLEGVVRFYEIEVRVYGTQVSSTYGGFLVFIEIVRNYFIKIESVCEQTSTAVEICFGNALLSCEGAIQNSERSADAARVFLNFSGFLDPVKSPSESLLNLGGLTCLSIS